MDLEEIVIQIESEDGRMSKDEFIFYKRIILIMWSGWMVLDWFVTGSQKAIFTTMAENLTYDVRLDLIRALFHK